MKLLDPERKIMRCEIHGEYEAREVCLFGKTLKWTGCPKCAEEEEQVQKAHEKTATAERQERAWLGILNAAGIPEKFIESTFDSFECSTPEQEHLLTMFRIYSELITAVIPPGINIIKSRFLCGTVGTGKTHLGCALLIDLLGRDPKFYGRYVSVMRMLREIRASYNRDAMESEQDAIDRFTTYELLVLDEVGVQLGTAAEKMLLFEVINGRYENNVPTVLISNLNLEGITEYLGERSIDRLRENGGEVLIMAWDSYRKRKGE